MVVGFSDVWPFSGDTLFPACNQAWPIACKWKWLVTILMNISQERVRCVPLHSCPLTLSLWNVVLPSWTMRLKPCKREHQDESILGSWQHGSLWQPWTPFQTFLWDKSNLPSLLSYCFCHLLPSPILGSTDIESEISKKVPVSCYLPQITSSYPKYFTKKKNPKKPYAALLPIYRERKQGPEKFLFRF